MNRATGESTKQRKLMNQVHITNATLLSTTNSKAFFGETTPEGISRIAVRGLSASNFASSQRLNAMAALLAKIIHNTTIKSRMRMSVLLTGISELPGYTLVCQPGMIEVGNANKSLNARKKPINANGIAKMVWENLMRLRYFLISCIESLFRGCIDTVAHKFP